MNFVKEKNYQREDLENFKEFKNLLFLKMTNNSNHKIHSRAIYTSRHLPQLQNYQEINVVSEYSHNLNNLTNLSLTHEVDFSVRDNEEVWTTIHPNFTPELIQNWQNYGFAASEARDWININSPAEQEQAIQEPVYYAWLRDGKQVDSDWVHNYGNTNLLKQEYQEYLERQSQIEIPPKN